MSVQSVKKGRARKGTGTIYEYRPGKYRGMVDLGVNAEGRRIRKSFTGDSRKEVQAKIDQARSRILQGLAVQSSSEPVKKFFDEWMLQKKLEVRPSTYARYRNHLNAHIIPHMGDMKLKDLTPNVFNQMYDAMLKKGLKRSSINLVSMMLRTALDQAIKQGLLVSNPAREAANIESDTPEARFLAPREIRIVLAGAKDQGWIEFAIRTFLGTGMRIGELLGLTWSNLDFTRKRIAIDKAATDDGSHAFLGPTKTPASRRVIPMPADVEAALLRQRELVKELPENPLDLVFPNNQGGVFFRSYVIEHPFRRVLARASIISVAWRYGCEPWLTLELNQPLITSRRLTTEDKALLPTGEIVPFEEEDLLTGVTTHTLRHTYVSMLIANGVDIKSISYLVGHKRLSITMDIYSHLMPEQELQAVGAINKAFENLISEDEK